MVATGDWALVKEWHRVDQNGYVTLCGELVPQAKRVEMATAMADIRANNTTVCGRCDARADAAPRAARAEGIYMTPQRDDLSPEKQAIFDRRKADQERRKKFREAEDADKSVKRGPSVRTVRGGLPGGGRRG